MFEAILGLFSSFILGLLTPLTAVCVLPLYPGFLAYLSNVMSEKSDKKSFIFLGLIIVAGVILFMSILGIVFTTLLKISLTTVIGIISPIAFGVLGVISILLIFNLDVGRLFPRFHAPILKNPLWSAFIFGFFFGAIVVPCNPLFIAVLFTKTLTTTVSSFFMNFLNFVFFGLGIGFPLLVFAILSGTVSQKIIGYIVKQKSIINRVSGLIMLVISLYYLIFVFKIFGG